MSYFDSLQQISFQPPRHNDTERKECVEHNATDIRQMRHTSLKHRTASLRNAVWHGSHYAKPDLGMSKYHGLTMRPQVTKAQKLTTTQHAKRHDPDSLH